MNGEGGFEIPDPDGDHAIVPTESEGAPRSRKLKKLAFVGVAVALIVAAIVVTPLLSKKAPPSKLPEELAGPAPTPRTALAQGGPSVEVPQQVNPAPVSAASAPGANAPSPGGSPVMVGGGASNAAGTMAVAPGASVSGTALGQAEMAPRPAESPRTAPAVASRAMSNDAGQVAPVATTTPAAAPRNQPSPETELAARPQGQSEQKRETVEPSEKRSSEKSPSRTRYAGSSESAGERPVFARLKLRQVTLSEAWVEDRDGNLIVVRAGDHLPGNGPRVVAINPDNGSVVLDRGPALRF